MLGVVAIVLARRSDVFEGTDSTAAGAEPATIRTTNERGGGASDGPRWIPDGIELGSDDVTLRIVVATNS